MTNRLWQSWSILLLLGVGLGLRLGRIEWQPLWADEGYSIYFATESLSRMLWLTAQDIHPPLYYTLLHLWTRVTTPEPFFLRFLAVGLAFPALLFITVLARLLFPNRFRITLIALLLLTCNPLHLYYSQEVRMYGIAMSLTLASTVCLVQAVTKATTHRRRWWAGYVLATTAALYTLYYTVFLFLAHAFWLIWQRRGSWRKLTPLLWADGLIALLYAPWFFYVLSALTAYVEDKVGADQDLPLHLVDYLIRHLLAFLAGHLILPTWPPIWRWFGLIGLALVTLQLLWIWQNSAVQRPRRVLDRRSGSGSLRSDILSAHSALWCFILVPVAIAFLVNWRFPFFPDGGERLLLFVLPYVLLLLASGIDMTWSQRHAGKAALTLFLFVAGGGITTFYLLPRHVADDYRPLVRQIVQQGRNEDTVLATFPWQVGLWRSYAPMAGLPDAISLGPHISLVSERTLAWGPALESAITQALMDGTLWYPGLRSIGSTLPTELVHFLTHLPVDEQPVLLAERWYGNTTLQAWHRMPEGVPKPVRIDFGENQLREAAVTPTVAAAANTPVRIDLQWTEPPSDSGTGLTLRLQREGYLWANRDLDTVVTTTGLVVPAGLPPGNYDLLLGLVGEGGTLLPVADAEIVQNNLAPIAMVTVTEADRPPLVVRLPMRFPLSRPVVTDDIQLLGYSIGEQVPLAGENLTVTLFWQGQRGELPLRHLYLSLLDPDGYGVAGWAGWPVPDYPTTAWTEGTLLQTPVTFALPPTLTSSIYQLGAGLLNPMTGVKSPITILGEQALIQRTINYSPIVPPRPLFASIQLGSHISLLGYDVQRNSGELVIQLYWHVLQSLLPPHHIFLHLLGANGEMLAQSDGVPQTIDGPAPTGSWLPDEFLITTHTIAISAIPEVDSSTALELNIGLYLPETGFRLPTTAKDGAITGDHIVIPLQ